MKALVLSGGGSHGAWQAGVLYQLLTQQIKYDIVCGVSVGAINASCVAMFKSGEEIKTAQFLKNLWNTITTNQVYKNWFPFAELHALWKPSLYDSSPLMSYLDKNVDVKAILNSKKELRIVATGLSSGTLKVFDQNYPQLSKAIYASAAALGFTPIELDSQLFLDGGLKQVTPLSEAINLGAKDIDVLVTSPINDSLDFTSSPNVIDIWKRGLDIMSNAITENDVSVAIKINQWIKQGIVLPGKNKLNLNIYRPSGNLGDSMNFDQSNVQPMFEMGLKDSLKLLESIKY